MEQALAGEREYYDRFNLLMLCHTGLQDVCTAVYCRYADTESFQSRSAIFLPGSLSVLS